MVVADVDQLETPKRNVSMWASIKPRYANRTQISSSSTKSSQLFTDMSIWSFLHGGDVCPAIKSTIIDNRRRETAGEGGRKSGLTLTIVVGMDDVAARRERSPPPGIIHIDIELLERIEKNRTVSKNKKRTLSEGGVYGVFQRTVYPQGLLN